MAVPVAEDVAVTFSLAGYQPQTIPVTMQNQPTPGGPNDRGEFDVSKVRLAPNPVYAELVAVAPAKPAPARRAPAARPTAAAKPAPQSAPPQRARGAPSPFPDPPPPPPR
jgi:hypothetical protein